MEIETLQTMIEKIHWVDMVCFYVEGVKVVYFFKLRTLGRQDE